MIFNVAIENCTLICLRRWRDKCLGMHTPLSGIYFWK